MVLWEILSEFKANIVVILGNNLNILGRFCEDFYSIFLGKFGEILRRFWGHFVGILGRFGGDYVGIYV